MRGILVVEDSPESQELIRRALRDRFDLAFADTGAKALEQAISQVPDLIVLDVGLPDMDGFALCAKLKSMPVLEDVPVVFLTGRGETDDKLLGFKLGADDYVEKPFQPDELVARIEARLRAAKKPDPKLQFDDMQLDPLRLEVVLRGPDREWTCDLTPHEFRILHCLAKCRSLPVPRARLMEAAWGGVTVSERTVDTHVSNLRKKLTPYGDRLQSVRGVGYRLLEPEIS